jgi:hypothetical protein
MRALHWLLVIAAIALGLLVVGAASHCWRLAVVHPGATSPAAATEVAGAASDAPSAPAPNVVTAASSDAAATTLEAASGADLGTGLSPDSALALFLASPWFAAYAACAAAALLLLAAAYLLVACMLQRRMWGVLGPTSPATARARAHAHTATPDSNATASHTPPETAAAAAAAAAADPNRALFWAAMCRMVSCSRLGAL